jgi:hypothetical protein
MITRHAALVFALLLATPALADGSTVPPPDVPPPESVVLTGAVKEPQSITKEELSRLPPVDVTLNAQSDKGAVTGTFRGVLLWTLIDRAGLVNGTDKNAYLKHTFLVSGVDGYTVALSEGEIDPKLENKQVIIAYMQDGKLFDGLRLIVPGDAHASRDVRDLLTIEVK